MAGAITGPESLLALGPQPGLHAQAVDGPAPDADALYEALSGPVTEEPTGLRAGDIGELADLDLWLTLAEPGLTRLNLMGRHEAYASPAQQRIANLMPLGGLAQVGLQERGQRRSEARASSSTGPMSASPCGGRRCDGAN